MNNEQHNDPFEDPARKPSPLSRLPHKSPASASFLPPRPAAPEEYVDSAPAVTSQEAAPQTQPRPASVFKGFRLKFGPPFWTIASILSLTVNVVLIIVLFMVWVSVPTINLNSIKEMGNGLLGGLYSNFEKMDRAHITRTIPVQTTIPVKFDLPINQQTTVVLSQDVTIDNARVTVRTGGLNITNALTTIVLPQGTSLPIVLNITVPVETTVPVALNVEVDIPLNETQLHDPFVGLRKVVEPFYCMLNHEALNLDGQKFCP